MGFNPDGDFHFISDVKGTKFFLYFFNKQLQANSVALRAFGFHHILTDSVYESYDDLSVEPSSLPRINLSFRFMEVDQYSTAMQECQAVVAEVVKKCLEENVDLKPMLLSLKENVQEVATRPVSTVALQEESLNTYVKEKIAAVARSLGYIVATNKSTSPMDHYSRFASSKPDLYMCSRQHHCGFVVEHNYLQGMVTENKINNSNPRAQLLGNMEKLAGDLVHHHLQSCGIVFEHVRIYGLILNYADNLSTSYCLKMNFKSKSSTFEEEMETLSVERGLNRLLAQMQVSIIRKQLLDK